MADRESSYTPTTQDVREAWLSAECHERDWSTSDDDIRGEFDRWLAAHDAEVLRDAARSGVALAFRNIRARMADEEFPLHLAADIEQIICEDGGDWGTTHPDLSTKEND